jgi:hypothetical protein
MNSPRNFHNSIPEKAKQLYNFLVKSGKQTCIVYGKYASGKSEALMYLKDVLLKNQPGYNFDNNLDEYDDEGNIKYVRAFSYRLENNDGGDLIHWRYDENYHSYSNKLIIFSTEEPSAEVIRYLDCEVIHFERTE